MSYTYDMEYRFGSETKTVYLDVPYKLIIQSDTGIALDSNGNGVLHAVVRNTNTGAEVAFDDSCFTWTRKATGTSDGDWPAKNGARLAITKSDLVYGSANFIVSFKKAGLFWSDTNFITISETVKGEKGDKGDIGQTGPAGPAGPAGENGWSQATVQLFRRSNTIPTEKPLALNYAFRTGALSSGVVGKTLLECLNGWSQTVVAGTSPLYVIYASAFNNTETDPIDPNDWTPAAVLSENGTKGENGYTVANVVLYKRFATQPTTPSETITYNFYIGTIQGNLDGWSKDFPADDGNPLWVTNATASTRITGVEISSDDKDTITPSEWSTPQIMAKHGAKGDKGDKTYVHIAYANSADGATDFSLTESLNKKYLGQCTNTNATAPTEPSAYKWTKIEGASGKDGESSYVHIAYANSKDGTLDFSTSISVGKKYLGQCVDKNADSPTDPTAYKWTEIKGEKGDTGAKGEKGDDGYSFTVADRSPHKATLAVLKSYENKKKDTWRLNSFTGKIGDTLMIPCIITDLGNVAGYIPFTITAWNGPPNNIATGDNGYLIYGDKGDTGAKGDPAPYARQIYIASPTKPATPTGTAEQVPDLWSLQIPARTEKQVIWTSIAVVDVKNGQYVYGTWSEPSKYTPDQSDIALIVEWKWGASDVVNPDEENTTIALEDDTILSVNGQAVTFSTNDPTWSKTIPEQPADKPYLWKREWQYAYIGDDGTEHQAGWVYYCVTGKLGVEGSYQGLGYAIAGSSIIFAGLDTDGKPTLASFRISINGKAVAFQRKSFNINGAYNRYFLVAYWDLGIGYVDICYINPLSETDADGVVSHRMQWVTLGGNEISTTAVDGVSYEPYVLADIKMKGQAIDSVTLLNPTALKAFEKDYFMSILAQDDIGNIKDVAKALDVERVFEKIAAMEAFFNRLFANQLRIYGAIYGGGYDKDGKNVGKQDGFYLSKDGTLKAVNVTFTTGTIDDVEITNAVLHGDLKSDAITTYKTISASPIDKTFTQDLYSLRDAYSKITKKWQYSPLGSGNTYDGETITEYAVASSVPQPASLTMTSANPASLSDLVVGRGISREQNVHAGNNYWMINVMINKTSAPIYVDCSCSLYGNMNTIYIEHWDKANVSQKIQHGWAWKGYIFPNEGIGVWTGSSALWGDRTGAATIKAYASDGLPFEKATKISDNFSATTESSSSSLNKTFTTYTASNTYVRVIIHKYEISTGSYVLISSAKETKKYTGNSKDGIDAWFNVSGPDSKITISTFVTGYTEESGEDETSYRGVVNLYGIGIFEYKWNTYADSLFFKYGNKMSVTNCSFTDIDAINWVNANDHPMILPNAGYSTAVQSNRLRLSGATVYNYLKPLLANGTEFDYSSKTSSVIINGITISNIQRINYDNDSIMFYTSEGVTYRIYRNTFNINSVYTSIKLSLYPVAEIERAETTTLVPKGNSLYNIGSESKKYSTIYANKFMGNVNNDGTKNMVWGAVAN